MSDVEEVEDVFEEVDNAGVRERPCTDPMPDMSNSLGSSEANKGRTCVGGGNLDSLRISRV